MIPMVNKKVISGIQQIGIGVRDAHAAWEWYREHFGMDIEVFEEEAVAELMVPHTNNVPIPRHAILAMNMQGGGGFEIWQQTKYEAVDPLFDLQLGDLGIYSCKIKCRNVSDYYKQCLSNGLDILGNICTDPDGRTTFYLRDPYGNIFQIVEANNWYKNEKRPTGGTYGAIIGVSDIEKAMVLYSDILEHDEIIYDQTDVFDDLQNLPGGNEKVRRVLLKNSTKRKGAFGKLLCSSEIELVQCVDRTPHHIFKDRIWGDLGYIHLCFDTHGMDLLKNECADKGFTFTVDSADSFDMGVAAGRFAYAQDPDGTLIEFVETHKVPIIKKLGWYMNLEERDPEKHLPNWMVNTLAWKRKKN
jgi:catechol 2,3-dioxygenase-like lactoylglutathione lyase family enzyme